MTYREYYIAAKAQGASDEVANTYAKDMTAQWDEDKECEGHPSGPYDYPMGQTVYCDGSCKPKGA